MPGIDRRTFFGVASAAQRVAANDRVGVAFWEVGSRGGEGLMGCSVLPAKPGELVTMRWGSMDLMTLAVSTVRWENSFQT
ncbi:MAG: hypothetical protein SFV54_01505 [Bryobacteraceae bacterium]|nr:hypothetical protein [Bryobacteraceae bacterium]